MALPPPSSPRRAIHRRTIEVDVFRRDDGLFDLEARLVDAKPHPIELIRGPVAANEPIHDLRLRSPSMRRSTWSTRERPCDAMPVPGACDAIHPDYRRLVGLSLVRSFRRGQGRLAGTRGCTHLSELAGAAAHRRDCRRFPTSCSRASIPTPSIRRSSSASAMRTTAAARP
jgi:hypothetical protein